jgi:MHS family proline/betaine transporter-like MFS transporter
MRSLAVKNIIAIVIGNALEWYDFVVYSFLTIFIAKLFFPSVNYINSLLAATATFGVAFCMRPLGGIFFGLYADKWGRQSAMTIVITLMSIAMAIVAFTPTYQSIGVFAPLLIVLARLLQGFSAGGEFGVSTSLLIELSPVERRGFYTAWQMVGQMIAMLLGATLGFLLTHYYSMQEVEQFAWRVPFMFGLIIAPVGIYLRNQLSKSMHDQAETFSLKTYSQDISAHAKQIVIAMGLVAGGTAANYTNISYMPTYAATYLHLPLKSAYLAVAIAVAVMIIVIPLIGALSDRIGRRSIMLYSISTYLIIVYPLFLWLTHDPSFIKLLCVELICCILLGMYFGVFAVAIAELFPASIRSSGMGISYNLTVMCFGGFAQFLVSWLIHLLNTPMAITYYVLSTLFISLMAAYHYQQPVEKLHELSCVA